VSAAVGDGGFATHLCGSFVLSFLIDFGSLELRVDLVVWVGSEVWGRELTMDIVRMHI
jgi:hypothetical protein